MFANFAIHAIAMMTIRDCYFRKTIVDCTFCHYMRSIRERYNTYGFWVFSITLCQCTRLFRRRKKPQMNCRIPPVLATGGIQWNIPLHACVDCCCCRCDVTIVLLFLQVQKKREKTKHTNSPRKDGNPGHLKQ